MKRCSCCHVDKAETEFYRNRALSDGLGNQCKACHKANQQRYRETDKGRAALARATARWRKRHPTYKNPVDPVKRRARFELNRALTLGLSRPSRCASCGSEDDLQAHHHNGYDREHWLDVIWLCSRCHGEVHRRAA